VIENYRPTNKRRFYFGVFFHFSGAWSSAVALGIFSTQPKPRFRFEVRLCVWYGITISNPFHFLQSKGLLVKQIRDRETGRMVQLNQAVRNAAFEPQIKELSIQNLCPSRRDASPGDKGEAPQVGNSFFRVIPNEGEQKQNAAHG
jgi:hypothetical protein